MRTTSSLEAMNAVLRRTFPNHPHVFKFIDRLKIHEFSKYLEMLEAVRSIGVGSVVRKKKKDQIRDNKINCLTLALKIKNLTPGEFLKSMSTNKDGDVLPMIGNYFFSSCTNEKEFDVRIVRTYS